MSTEPTPPDALAGGEGVQCDRDAADTSWFLIAVGRRKISGYRDCVILDYADGWSEFGVEFYWEDTFQTDPPTHLEPGAYLWTGFRIGYWGEDDHLNVTGGLFVRHDPEAASRLAALEQEGERMREALEMAAEKFREYERMHRDRWDDMPHALTGDQVREAESRWAKAERNREMAELCEAALPKPEAGGGGEG